MNNRIPLASRRPLDPRRVNIFVDGNVFNRGQSAEADRLIDRLEALEAASSINFVMAGGVRDEMLDPATPAIKQGAAMGKIFNLRPSRNEEQQGARRVVATILQGNAKPETHAADASHLSEAVETGCGYFITGDGRILRMSLPDQLDTEAAWKVVSAAEANVSRAIKDNRLTSADAVRFANAARAWIKLIPIQRG